MLRRSISVLLIMVMVLSIFTIIPITVSAESTDTADTGDDLYDGNAESGADDFPYSDSGMYVADSIIQGIIDKQGTANGSSEVLLALQHNYTYRNLAEAAVDDGMLMFNSLFWQNLKKTLSGEFLEIANWEEEMYILLIMDYLNYYTQSSEFESNYVKNTVKFTEKICKAAIKYADAEIGQDYYDSIDDIIANQSLTDAMAFSDTYGFVHKLKGYTKLISGIEEGVTTGADYLKKLSKALAVQQADEDRIRFLREMKKAGMGNDYFTSAVDTVISMYESTFAGVTYSTGTAMLNYGVSKCFDLAKDACPAAKTIIDGMKLYNEGLNWLFNSNDISENNLKLVIVYTMGSYAAQAVRSLRDTYTSNKTADNANAFIEGYLGYLKYQEYASNSVYGFVSSALFDGLYNQIVNIFSDSNQATYKEFQNYINNDITFCERLEELVRKHYDLYYTFTGYQPNVLVVEVLDEPTDISDNQTPIPTDLFDNFRLSGQISIDKTLILSSDMTVYGNLYLNGGTLDLNGYTLSVGGDIIQSKGQMYINGGTLNIDGDYRIQTLLSNGEYTDSEGYLQMTDNAGLLNIGGDFITQSSRNNNSSNNYFNAGTIKISGNFYQYNGNNSNFIASGTHMVYFLGDYQHLIHLDSSNARFNKLITENSNVVFDNDIDTLTLYNDLTINGDIKIRELRLNGHTLTINGDLHASYFFDLDKGKLIVNGNFKADGDYYGYFNSGTINVSGNMELGTSITLNGGALNVNGDLLHTKRNINFGGGTLNVGGDYRIQTLLSDGEYTDSEGYLQMTDNADLLNIGGDFITQSSRNNNSSNNYFNAGTIKISGNFYQYNGNNSNFIASGTHQVILCGNILQLIHFDSKNCKFNILKLTKDKDTGYVFSPDNCWNKLITEERINSIQVFITDSVVKQGSSSHLISKINGDNLTDISVRWSVYGNTDSDTSISENGILTVGLNENAEKLTVTAVSVADPTKSASVEITVEKLERIVNGIFITPTAVSTIGGEKFKFTAYVYGIFSPSQEVTWMVSDNHSKGTWIDSYGVLIVASNETSDKVTVTATSVADPTKSASVTIDVYQIKVVSTVSNVTVTMETGEQQQLNVVVTGTNDPDQAVTWSVSGNNSKNTTVSATGLVSIAEDETADMIVVRATSVANPDKYGEFAINVDKKAELYILGDVDGDGDATVLDATYIQRFATRVKVPFTDGEMMRGDVDGDGEVTVVDATYIQRYATRVKVPYPIGE